MTSARVGAPVAVALFVKEPIPVPSAILKVKCQLSKYIGTSAGIVFF
jgi:hypothetical protein